MNRSFSKQITRDLSLTQITLLIFGACCFLYGISPQGLPAFYDLKHGAEVTRVALNLIHEGSFAHPFFALPTGPTAHTAPAYVFLFAFVGRIFGLGWMGAMVLWGLNICFLALQLALLPLLSRELGLGIVPGVIAALFGLLVQPYRVLPEWESLFTGALMVVLCVISVPYFRAPRDWGHSALLGFLWGIAILTNPECVLLLFAWPHVAASENSSLPLTRARRATIFVLAGAALACLPWFVRNYQQFHTVFFVRDNFGLELYTSNNSCAGPTIVQNIISGCHDQTHPNNNPALAAEVADEGEIRFNQDRLSEAKSWIASHPREFALLTLRRIAKFWFPGLNGPRYTIPTGILTILSFVGLALMYRNQRLAFNLLSSTLFLYPLIHYLIQFEARYRYPIFWATFLPAAYAVLEVVRRLRGVPRSSDRIGNEEEELAPVLRGAKISPSTPRR